MDQEAIYQDSLKVALFSLNKIEQDVAALTVKVDTLGEKIIKYDHQIHRCQSYFDDRYVRLENFGSKVKTEIEKHNDQRFNKAKNGAEYIKTILGIIQLVTPYLVLIGGYLLLRS